MGAEGVMTMGEKMRHFVAVILMGNIIVSMVLLTSCSSTPKTTDGSDARVKDEQNAPLYYDFGDVLVPRDRVKS
jgi:hypothetical protein